METIGAFDKRFSDDNACKAYLAAQRWPDGVRCPRCERKEKVYPITGKAFHWRCRNEGCGGRDGYKFSVITHTIFQDTKIPLKLWFKVAYLILTSKKGISALQVHRVIFGEDSGHDYRTSWFMCMRWRAAMKGDVLPLEGEVEVDEMYIGGKAENMHLKKRKALALTGTKGKVAVIGAIARKGMVVAKVIENTDTATLDSFVRQTVSQNVRLLATDEHSGYRFLGKHMNHRVVRHSAGEYVVGTTHTNTIEGFWSLFKRGIVGSYHKVSKDYLPLYLNEFSWRFNNRKNPDMFGDLITTCSQ
ncbi:MAG TPA: IS1595 family transposase [Candidatus Binataceae bacterium]|nr:IS1595 family transposase [Candidatus Binataceae bacterium]